MKILNFKNFLPKKENSPKNKSAILYENEIAVINPEIEDYMVSIEDLGWDVFKRINTTQISSGLSNALKADLLNLQSIAQPETITKNSKFKRNVLIKISRKDLYDKIHIRKEFALQCIRDLCIELSNVKHRMSSMEFSVGNSYVKYEISKSKNIDSPNFNNYTLMTSIANKKRDIKDIEILLSEISKGEMISEIEFILEIS